MPSESVLIEKVMSLILSLFVEANKMIRQKIGTMEPSKAH